MSTLPPLKSFSLTHILYDPAHPLSIPLTLLSLSPIFLFVSYFTLLIFTRRLTIALLAGGQLVNEVLSWALKRIVKEGRPYTGHGELSTGYAWPSSHAQAAGFLVAWGLGYAWTMDKRSTKLRSQSSETIRRWRTGIYVLGLIAWSVGVSYSRYHLHYHSPSQIVAGYLVGNGYGALHFLLSEYYPLYHSTSLLARLRRGVEYVWEGIGGVGGWNLGDAQGGWGEGWMLAEEADKKRT
ncbi:hypothetical protein B9479_003379 [Cryptococcus floricola]|uniref:Dolichyldiphosphatase n=1 Tax=Cryptococcus floricola TaxID=2591691 RepID=A0A5D3B121_9TREE|nr:hypothetical protein B9479_003379 [Cryptococcus floricola]